MPEWPRSTAVIAITTMCFLGTVGCGGSTDVPVATAQNPEPAEDPSGEAPGEQAPVADDQSSPEAVQGRDELGQDEKVQPTGGQGDAPGAGAATETVHAEQGSGDADDSSEQEPDRDGAGQADGDHPFPNRLPGAEFPKDLNWINTSGPLRKQDLKGKFVLLDFWTYCCINCMHILPELKKLEHAYPNELVVIGVHSAKFETEKDSKNISEAVMRYEIEHPVVNDANHQIWDAYYCQSWPSLRIVDPEGNLVAGHSGEFDYDLIDGFLKQSLPYYQKRGLMDERPLRFDLLAARAAPTALRFPGKVLAHEESNRLFISDSNHNRIVISSLDGRIIDIIGSGRIGRADGSYEASSFNHPQGVALRGNDLYVCDTENHMLRLVDLEHKSVRTIAGTGAQGTGWPGLEELEPGASLPRFVGKPATTKLNSPWALWIHGEDLFIAMAGPHQIWRMPLNQAEIGPYAGNGREDIVDGLLLPDRPYDTGFTDPVSSFAQPSGLASDGTWLYVADSEGSSIRAVPFDPDEHVRTVVGTANLSGGRLFEFGDRDGLRDDVLLQHALGVAFDGGKLYIADTYNNKIKVINAVSGETRTLAGTGESGRDDAAATFDEPAGVSIAGGFVYVADTNNHLIRKVEISTGKVTTLELAGLAPPDLPREPVKPSFAGAEQIEVPATAVRLTDQRIRFDVALTVPEGWKLSPDAPLTYLVEADGTDGPIDRRAFELVEIESPSASFPIDVPATGNGSETMTVSMNFYYCAVGGEGLCKAATVQFRVQVDVSDSATGETVALVYEVK